MTSLFKKHKRTPKELALKVANALNTLKDSGDTKDQESCGKYLADMRAIMYGDGEHPPDPTLQSQLTEAVHAADGLLASVVIHLPKLFFETRKDAAVSRSARRPRTDSAARCRWWELPCPECAMMSREPRPRKGGSGARFARSARRESGRVDAFTRTDVRTSAVCILRGCRRAGTCDGWIPER